MDGGLSLLLHGNGDGTFTPVPAKSSGLVVRGDAKSAVVTDFNDDGWPDLIVGVNDAAPLLFRNGGSLTNRLINVRLRGNPGNPTAIGARVTLLTTDGKSQTAEVYGGGGYWSQSSPAVALGLGPTAEPKTLHVRWPNGQVTSTSIDPDKRRLAVRQR